jgi:hypothetical protein
MLSPGRSSTSSSPIPSTIRSSFSMSRTIPRRLLAPLDQVFLSSFLPPDLCFVYRSFYLSGVAMLAIAEAPTVLQNVLFSGACHRCFSPLASGDIRSSCLPFSFCSLNSWFRLPFSIAFLHRHVFCFCICCSAVSDLLSYLLPSFIPCLLLCPQASTLPRRYSTLLGSIRTNSLNECCYEPRSCVMRGR